MGIFDFMKRGKRSASSADFLPLDGVPASPREPRTIAVWSSKGGVGKTTVAVNLAGYLGSLGFRTVVVDIDEFGDAGTMAGRQEHYGSSPPRPERLCEDLFRIGSAEQLEGYLMHNPEAGCWVLPPSGEDDQSRRIDAKCYREISGLLLRYFDTVIYDCGPSYFQDTIRQAITDCDCLVAVFTQNQAMMDNFNSMVREFIKPASGVGADKMVLVLNNYRDIPGVTTEKKAREWFAKTGCPLVRLDLDTSGGFGSVAAGRLLLQVTKSRPLKEGYRELVRAVLAKLYPKDEG